MRPYWVKTATQNQSGVVSDTASSRTRPQCSLYDRRFYADQNPYHGRRETPTTSAPFSVGMGYEVVAFTTTVPDIEAASTRPSWLVTCPKAFPSLRKKTLT